MEVFVALLKAWWPLFLPAIVGAVTAMKKLFPKLEGWQVVAVSVLVGISAVLYVQYLIEIPVFLYIGVGAVLGLAASGVVDLSGILGYNAKE